ncbi:class I SAM-dependent methyltransferase [Bradyrhizobium jicamae]|uniref:Class I SAM-dependent methyltransferase n=2 Tax=Bradyrhizobium jicamae TaxID=280332 RepID=A0ABS5FK44_9BRAD|nr:class I SAM-dependent methyltransferase [Bradyrhizobium jicamae]
MIIMASVSRLLAHVLPPLPRWRAQVLVFTIRSLVERAAPVERNCNICGRDDLFRPFGWPMRPEAMCPHCRSLERHRLLKLWLDQNKGDVVGKRILHFAPETTVTNLVRPLAGKYVTTDICPGYDLQLNIEKIDLPDSCYDLILCSHVLEHVDDRAALGEMRRILTDNGVALLMTPVIEGWSETYENPSVVAPDDREIHFGQKDHVRYYGSNIRDRVRQAGFEIDEFTAEGSPVVMHGLMRGEKLFVARRRAAAQ